MVLGTRAHQLALYVIFESPLQMVSDAPESYKGENDFEFIKQVPASWDETRFVAGRVGEYAVIARRSGDDWYIGGITNWTARELELPLTFLSKGDYVADIYADAPDSAQNPKHTTIERKPLTASTLKLPLAPGGGFAIRVHAAR